MLNIVRKVIITGIVIISAVLTLPTVIQLYKTSQSKYLPLELPEKTSTEQQQHQLQETRKDNKHEAWRRFEREKQQILNTHSKEITIPQNTELEQRKELIPVPVEITETVTRTQLCTPCNQRIEIDALILKLRVENAENAENVLKLLLILVLGFVLIRTVNLIFQRLGTG